MVNNKGDKSNMFHMPLSDIRTPEVTRLRIREFNRVKLGSGVKLVKCEVCGHLTDHGTIIDWDILEKGESGQLEKTGYERWTLCPECAQNIIEKVNHFTDELLDELEKAKYKNV